ncbi:MAG: signal peptidase, partial [Aeromicrobium sp.]|nr:signal peptidase [Aeromicrobium sp.]
MTQHGIVRTAREAFLTLGAVLGVVCIVVTAIGFAFGVKPLIFRSGSMSPAIHTGDMSISRTV